MQIIITWKTLVWATKYNEITFTFPTVVLENWDRSIKNNDIVNETFGFTALYSKVDGTTISATLQNGTSTQYI
jgi:hypothetical protein